MKALSSEWFTHHRERMSGWHHHELDDLADVINDLEQMLIEVHDLVRSELAEPKHVTVTASQEGNTMTSFAPGATITLTAVSDNAENVPVADTYTWTTIAGTISAGPDSTTATLVNAPLGDVTVTATDPAGLVGTLTVTVADQTPATITVTAA